jgi:hypothetical protein
MTRTINRAGDRMLGLLLGRREAGACVPENGTWCKDDWYGGCTCTNGHLYASYCSFFYNCLGTCIVRPSTCITQVKHQSCGNPC